MIQNLTLKYLLKYSMVHNIYHILQYFLYSKLHKIFDRNI